MAQQLMRGRRRWILVAIAAVIVLALVLSALSGFYVDLLWFREVHFGGVFWTVYWSKVLLGTLAGALFFVLLVANLVIARRLTPRFRPFSPEQELMERYRAVIDPYARYIIPIFAGFIAIFVGLAGSSQWQVFLLWRHSAAGHFPAAMVDPLFHRDPGFYIFSLPFLKFVQGWLFSTLVGITVIVAIAHYLSGGIRIQAPGEKVTPQVKAHLSVLLGLIFLVKAWGYSLGKFDLLVSPRGVVTGASYTDIHAELPALRLLVFIAIACALLFLVNIRVRGWALPIVGIGLLALTSIVAGAIVPAIVQKLRVAPQELQKETPYIQRNIDATRFAFGIRIGPSGTSPASDVTASAVAANPAIVSNIRLWNPAVLKQTYQSLQRIQPYYEFSDVDVDRYQVGGQERMIMLSAREVSQAGIPGGGGWQAAHLIYTHGFGAAASLVNTATSSGAPDFVLQNIPPTGSGIKLSPQKGSQVYYGELSDVPYVVADTGQAELNFPNQSGAGSANTRYGGQGGIPIGGFFRRLVFAYRYHDFNLLISGLINGDSKILINRRVQDRVSKAAPFLTYDADPYVAIVGGRIKYILDAYTTTNNYPYSERVSLPAITNNDLGGQLNYVRNSVKAVVDAYDGTVKYYVTDPTDPLIRVWESVFPHLFTDVRKAPPELVAHFRYPEDLFQIQASQFARYHVTDPTTFFSNDKRWSVPDALATNVGANATATGTLRPYYVLLKLPGDANEQFVLFEPFTPFGRQNMVSYLAAGSDPGHYGTLTAFQFPSGENVFGPSQVRNLVQQDPQVSSQITLLSQKGSDVTFGDLIIVPIEDSFLYVQPIFVQASSASPIPELKRVVVVHGGSATIDTSLDAALAASFGQTTPTPTPTPSGPPPTGKVGQLLAQALQHFQTAQQDLRNGDLAGYQREINAAQRLVQEAQQAAKTATPSPSPSPSG